jgi:hypothetical protein
MYGFYCLSYNNPSRTDKMRDKFNKIGEECFFYKGVGIEDYRMRGITENNTRVVSCMWGHLDMIKEFYDSDNEYGIFCEDDILINKDLPSLIPSIIDNFKKLNLDILLMSCLFTYDIDYYKYCWHTLAVSVHQNREYNFHSYADKVWGAQMYLISKKYAKELLDKYYINSGYLSRSLFEKDYIPFSVDWTITKNGKRALIYPMMALENRDVNYEDKGQELCRNLCFELNYKQDIFV